MYSACIGQACGECRLEDLDIVAHIGTNTLHHVPLDMPAFLLESALGHGLYSYELYSYGQHSDGLWPAFHLESALAMRFSYDLYTTMACVVMAYSMCLYCAP